MALSLGVLVSGNGTNLQAILDAVGRGELDARVRVVISNKSEALALERARKADVPALCIPHKAYATRDAFDAAVLEALRAHGVEWVVLAGFMRVLTPGFLAAWGGRVVNIHPALLPAFPGVNAISQALAHGVKVTGCTVHFVDAGIVSGPIVLQAAVPVLDDDTSETLSARILEREHALYPEAVRSWTSGRMTIDGRRVRISTRDTPVPEESR